MRERRSQAGSVVIEVVWLAVLLLVPLVYVVLAVFEVQRGAFAATAAARAAGRAYVLAPTPAEGEEVAGFDNPPGDALLVNEGAVG